MTSANFAALRSTVIAESTAGTWDQALHEWELADLDRDPQGRGICVCGQTGLVDLYTIANRNNGHTLFPIGSSCIHIFGREDLDRNASVLSGLLRLRSAYATGERIELTGKYFSRAILEHLHDAGVFIPNQWNGGNGRRDYEFLLRMFNKRDKDAITRPQRAKILALLRDTVLPFVRADERLDDVGETRPAC